MDESSKHDYNIPIFYDTVLCFVQPPRPEAVRAGVLGHIHHVLLVSIKRGANLESHLQGSRDRLLLAVLLLKPELDDDYLFLILLQSNGDSSLLGRI